MQVNIENKIFFKNTKKLYWVTEKCNCKKVNIVFSLYLQYGHKAIFIVWFFLDNIFLNAYW